MATPVAVDPAPAVDGASAEADFLWEKRKYLLLLATLAATVTSSAAGLSPPGGFWPDNVSANVSGVARLAGDPALRVTYPRRYQAFFYCNATAFVASLVTVNLLLVRSLQRNHRIRRCCTLPAAMTRDFVGLISALVYLVQEALRRHLQSGRPEHRIEEEQQSRASERADDDAYQILRTSHKYLLLLGILSASITYQAGLNPPGGFWQDKAADPVLHIAYPRRYQVFFYCNATAFVASLVLVVLLLSNIFSTQRIKYCALQATMILDLFGLIGAYAAGSCWEVPKSVPKSVYVSVLVVSAFLYVGFHVFMMKVLLARAASSEAPREKMAPCVPGLSKPVYQVHAEGDEAMERKLEKSRKLLLLLAILAASLTYRADMSPPGGLWQENESSNLVFRLPVVNDNYRRQYLVFFYCNAAAFVASIAIIMLLVNRRPWATGIRSYALQVCLILGFLGLMGAYAAGSYRKISMVDVLFLFLAVIACISLQIALFVSGSARGPVKRLAPELGWPQVLGDRHEGDYGSGAPLSSTPREQLVSPLFHGACKVVHSLYSGTWMFILVWVIWMPSLRPNLKVKLKVSKISAVLGVLLVSAAPMTATTTMDDTPGIATPPGTGMVRRRWDRPPSRAEDEPTRPRRNRRPNSRLIGQDWVN